MNTHLRRSVVALATTLACLAVMASPASAATHDAIITNGTVTATGTNGIIETYTIGGGGAGCTSTLVVDDGTGTTANVVSYTDTRRFSISTSTNHYVAVTTRIASTAGTLTGTTVNSLTVTLRTDIFLAANNTSTATDCTPTGNRACRITVTFHFMGTLSGTPIGTSTTVHLNSAAATIAVTPPCVVPFATFSGGTASVTSLSAHALT